MFYYLFFMQETIGLSKEHIIRLPLIADERAVPFTCSYRKEDHEGDDFRFRLTGTYASGQVRYRTSVKDGSLNMFYALEKDDFTLKKMEGACHLVTGKEREILFKITRL